MGFSGWPWHVELYLDLHSFAGIENGLLEVAIYLVGFFLMGSILDFAKVKAIKIKGKTIPYKYSLPLIYVILDLLLLLSVIFIR